MLPLTRSRNRSRFFGAQQSFSPASLFAGGTVAGAWYDPSDLSTLFTTSAGTTQCAMPGQGSAVSVGRMLDKSQGLVLGPELVTNGNFSSGTTTGWTGADAVLSVVSGQLGVTPNDNFTRTAYQSFSVTAGRTYVLQFNYNQNTATTLRYFGGTLLGSGSDIPLTILSGSGFVTRYFTATGSTLFIQFGAPNSTGLTALFDNISVREVPGNHAIAFNDTTARPELRARVNLLTYSEEFDNAAWTKINTTITQNAVANPLTGTVNADALFETVVNGAHSITQGPATEATRYTYSVYVKSNGRSRIAIAGGSSYGGNLGSGIFFDIESGAYISGAAAGAVPSITNAGNGWFLVSYTWTAFAFAGNVLGVYLVDSGTNTSYAGDVTKGIYIWGADFRPANIGANVPAYQRIADANTYDTSGFPLYLRFDGIDDSMYTPANLNLSGTDKVSVFAGVRKLSDAADGVIAELSTNYTDAGGWYLVNVTSPVGYQYSGRGNRAGVANDSTNAPITGQDTSVLTAQQNINNNTSATIRRNGALAGSSVNTTFGGGNFGTYPLYIGSRANSSIWFNGHLYSLIIAGSVVSAGNISATEQWVAQRTGIVIP